MYPKGLLVELFQEVNELVAFVLDVIVLLVVVGALRKINVKRR